MQFTKEYRKSYEKYQKNNLSTVNVALRNTKRWGTKEEALEILNACIERYKK